MIARLTYIAGPDTMDPTNVDRYWPDNAERTMCKMCGEVEVREEDELCAACHAEVMECAPSEDGPTTRELALAHYLKTNVTTITQ